jgi:phosphocarrier protein HPr
MNDAGGAETITRTVRICNTRGLHARAAAKFVKCAATFTADVTVSRDGNTVPGLSIMGLMMLAASNGSEIEIQASGTDAEAASDALCKLVEAGFDETS